MIERESVARRRSIARALLLMAFLALCGVLCACADSSKYVMHVDASAQPVSYGKRYVILPGLMDVKVDDPGFQAVAAHLDGMLAAKGYTKVAAIDQADLGLYLAYGVKERRGEGYHTDTGFFLEGNQGDMPQAPQAGEEVAQLHIPTPRRPAMINARVFIRSLELEAVDLARYRANDPANMVWHISVSSPGSTVSLEKAMPYFLAILSEYIEKKAYVDVRVDSDFNIVAIKPKNHKHGHMP